MTHTFPLLLAVLLLGAAVLHAADPIVIPPLPTADAIATAPSFGPDERVVATHYFYWYRWPDEHFFDDPPTRRHDILRQHFPDPTVVSYESPAWHRQQMEDLRAAGIDVALLVYWGAPNQYEKGEIRFSVHGIPPLVQALDELAKEPPEASPAREASDVAPIRTATVRERSGRIPRIGLFYDTSTLLAGHAFTDRRKENVDLRTDEGKDIFYRTIRDFYRLVPPRHWACLDGRPIVALYEASFATGHDQSTIDYVYEHFAADFAGRRPFVISGPSWSFKADAKTGWGAALNGPIIGEGACQVGPGYDDSPVPGRMTPTRDRLGGGFYAASWLLALQARPRIVIVETWSELHEGTPICETLEDGRFYIDLTRHFSDLFKAGQAPAADDWADAVKTLMSAPVSNRAGREFASRMVLEFSVAGGKPVERGVRLCQTEDGLFEFAKTPAPNRDREGAVADAPSASKSGDIECVRTRRGVGAQRYLYFDVADPYYYDHRGALTLRLTYLDSGKSPIVIEYDSAADTGRLSDRYKPHTPPIARGDTGQWKTVEVTLPAARAANRQNAGADFRLTSPNADVCIRKIEVTKLPWDYAETK